MPDLDQINITVTDIIPPDNFATVDAGVKLGTVYTKEQDNAWRKEVEAITQSGIKGIAKPDTPYDPVTNPIPTPWTVGSPNLYEKYDINEAGVFPNFIKINDQPVEVTSQELQLNEVQIWVNNGVSEKILKSLPKATQSIVPFSTSTFPLVAPTPPAAPIQRTHNDSIWQLKDGKTALITDIPGQSDVWISMGRKISPEFDPTIETEAQGGKQIADYFLETINKFDKNNLIPGYIDTTTGAINALANSFVSHIIPVESATFYYLSGRDLGLESWRFLDINGNILKPINNDGIQYTTFDTNVLNGKILTPANAISIQFQVVFNNIGSSANVKFEKGEQGTSYEPYVLKIKKELIPDLSSELKKITVIKSGNDVTMRSDFNGTNNDIVVVFTKSGGNNVFNFKSAKLLGKSSAITDIGLPLHGASPDDVSPVKVNDMYIGANHGNAGALTLTATAHGKTLADVGSRWIDNDGQIFIILKIISANQLTIISTNRGVNTWNFKLGIAYPLVHSSGAANTATIATGSTVVTQLYPAIKNHIQRILIDGKEITDDGNYEANNVTFSERYDIIDTVDMLDKLVANRPSGGYLVQPDFLNGNTLLTLDVNHIFTNKLNCVIVANPVNEIILKNIYYGGTQAEYNKPAWATEFKRLYPNSLPISDGVTTRDFKNPQNILGTFNANMNFTSAYWKDATKPPIRSVDNFQSTTKSVNFNIGFIPILSQENRVNQVNNAWFLATSKKQYPYAYDEKIGAQLPVNTFRSIVCFRGWSERSLDRFNEYLFEYNGTWYLILDYIEARKDLIVLPKDLLGKRIKVLQSDNVLVLSEVVTEKISVVASGVGFVYLELK